MGIYDNRFGRTSGNAINGSVGTLERSTEKERIILEESTVKQKNCQLGDVITIESE